jgi:uncharacterized coiled-coil DUF342 family protein
MNDQDRIHSLEAQVKELKDKLSNCEDSSSSWEAKAEQAEKEIDALVKERDLYNKNYLALEAQLEEANERWRNAEDDNIKKAKKLAEYHEANQKRHFRIVELEGQLEKDSELQAKMADGWCLVSPEDFERLQDKGSHGSHV